MLYNENKYKIQKEYNKEKDILNILNQNNSNIYLSDVTIGGSINKKLITYESEWIDTIGTSGDGTVISNYTEWIMGGLPSYTLIIPRYLNFIVNLFIPEIFLSYLSVFVVYETLQENVWGTTSESIQEVNSGFQLFYSTIFQAGEGFTTPIREKLIIQIYNPFQLKFVNKRG